MRAKHWIAIVAVTAVLLAIALAMFGVRVWNHSLFGRISHQMKAGGAYMDSLADADVQKWIERTKTYLAEYDPKKSAIDSTPVPPDLQALKILRIDVEQDTVSYVWVGGFDHTELVIQRLQDNNFEVAARYNDKKRRVIWQGRVANPQGGANGRQPSSSDTNRTSSAAASRGSP